jgi:tetratricopeptide (TPR) repeat protein
MLICAMRTTVRLTSLLAVATSFVAATAIPGPAASQKQKEEDNSLATRLILAVEEREAVIAYRRGERDVALRKLAEHPIDDQRRVVQLVLGELEFQRRNPYNARPPQPGAAKFSWALADLPAAGALHMDAALDASRRNDARSRQNAADQIKLAEALLGYSAQNGGDPTIAPRWELAIGLTAMADGRFALAQTFLDDSCALFKNDAPLQLACGCVHETLGMLPGPSLLPAAAIPPPRSSQAPTGLMNPHGASGPINPGLIRSGDDQFTRAKANAAAQLKKAREAFRRVLDIERDQSEAHLRLAHLSLWDGEDSAAALQLEPLLARSSQDSRMYYLTRLFLAEVRLRQHRLDEAATLLEEAVALVPSGQSAHVERARVAGAANNGDDPAALLHRMLNAPRTPRDPWVGYHFGQYWIPDPLIERLRFEAQVQ